VLEHPAHQRFSICHRIFGLRKIRVSNTHYTSPTTAAPPRLTGPPLGLLAALACGGLRVPCGLRNGIEAALQPLVVLSLSLTQASLPGFHRATGASVEVSQLQGAQAF
jgi:hypothetical protein